MKFCKLHYYKCEASNAICKYRLFMDISLLLNADPPTPTFSEVVGSRFFTVSIKLSPKKRDNAVPLLDIFQSSQMRYFNF